MAAAALSCGGDEVDADDDSDDAMLDDGAVYRNDLEYNLHLMTS